VLDPQGPIASAERLILLNATAIMLVVVLPVIVLTLAFAWRYRASNRRAAYRPDWSYSGYIELVTWSIPTMVVLLLAAVAWIGSHQLDPALSLQSGVKPIRIEVVSLDWKWLFIYPDQQVAAVNQLEIPTGVPVEFVLTSATVMNSFFVPQLGSQIYTMPGMTTRLNLLAERAGDYPGLSANFSGDGFSDMCLLLSLKAGSSTRARQVQRWTPILTRSSNGPASTLARPTAAWLRTCLNASCSQPLRAARSSRCSVSSAGPPFPSISRYQWRPVCSLLSACLAFWAWSLLRAGGPICGVSG
jgi:cytochrome o ubiquinol oxidase subunit II